MKTAVLTGATGAIGGAIARGLAASGEVGTLALVVRDAARGEALAAQLRSGSLAVRVAVADLVRPASVAACADELRASLGVIDVLINNAAAVPPAREEVDGLEVQWAVNVLSYLVLMTRLLPAMRRGGRVVCVASQLAGGLELADLQSARRPYDPRAVYSATKQANRMLAAEAAADGRGFGEAGVAVVSCHPGVVTSRLLSGLGWASGFDSADAGAALPLRLALGPAEPPSGTFWAGGAPGAVCRFGGDVEGRRALWAACEALVASRVPPLKG
jgi:NAD(P)-dependent dehydrogenase (short-subunit alcohol dehydrogenase family)